MDDIKTKDDLLSFLRLSQGAQNAISDALDLVDGKLKVKDNFDVTTLTKENKYTSKFINKLIVDAKNSNSDLDVSDIIKKYYEYQGLKYRVYGCMSKKVQEEGMKLHNADTIHARDFVSLLASKCDLELKSLDKNFVSKIGDKNEANNILAKAREFLENKSEKSFKTDGQLLKEIFES